MGRMIFHNSGLLTTIQDQGRYGWKRYGIPVSGPMDGQNAALANLLVNNAPHLPVIEITLHGPEIALDAPAVIAITGADLSPMLDDQSLSMNQPVFVRAGQRISFGSPTQGVRSYLAFSGGVETPQVLGSFSQYPGITPADRIRTGDQLTFRSVTHFVPPYASVRRDLSLFTEDTLMVYPGPDFTLLSHLLAGTLLEAPFSIRINNRMGYQLENPEIPSNELQIITSQVVPGTVQLTPSGKLMVLMRDAQVTGGYPRILQLTPRSIHQLAQKRTGEQVHFRLGTY